MASPYATTVPVPLERFLGPFERAALRRHRGPLVARARGRVLDLGGAVLEHLDLVGGPGAVGTVEHVDVVGANLRSSSVPSTVTVHDRALGALRLTAGSYDTVLTNLALCIVPDLRATLAELVRLLAPAGELGFVEPGLARGVQRLVETTTRLARLPTALRPRDIPAAIRAAGLTITDLERFTMPTPFVPLRSFVAGVARHPVSSAPKPAAAASDAGRP